MAQATIATAVRKESRYPATRAAAAEPGAARVRAAAMVASTASPTAAPTCCEAATSPPASPRSRASTPAVASTAVIGKSSPMPMPISSSPGSTLASYEPDADS